MEARTLSDADLEKLRPWAQDMVDKYEDVEDVQEVLETINEKYQKISTKPKLINKSQTFLVNRAKSAANIKFTGIGNLERFMAVFLGPTFPAKDWNAADADKIQKEAKKGQQAVMKMVKEEKIAYVIEAIGEGKIVKEQKRPIRKLNGKMRKLGKKWVVPKWLDKEKTKPGYELWTPGDPVVPLDTGKKLNDGERDNWNYGNVLKPNWSVTLDVLIWRDGQDTPRMTQAQFYGDPANPENKNFILDYISRKELWCRPCHLKAEFNEKKSKENSWFIKATNDRWAIKRVHVKDFDLYDKVVDDWSFEPAYTGDPLDAIDIVPEMDVLPPFAKVDLKTLREYHEKIQTYTDSSGDTKKRYEQLAVMECIALPYSEPESGNSIQIRIKDNALTKRRVVSFLPRIFTELPFAGAADVLLFISTNKKFDKELDDYVYYDRETGGNVVDEDGDKADIQINILNMEVLMEHDDEDTDEDGDEDEEEVDEPEEEARI
jgi:hypothetical protein